MKKIILDLRSIKTRNALYDLITERFDFPDYFGRNLDALFDCLTELDTPVCVGLTLPPDPACLTESTDPSFTETASDVPSCEASDDSVTDTAPEASVNPSSDSPDGASVINTSASVPADPGFFDYLQKLRLTFLDAEQENPHMAVLEGIFSETPESQTATSL